MVYRGDHNPLDSCSVAFDYFSYAEYRRFCNLTVPSTWEELTIDVGDSAVVEKLRRLYGHPGKGGLHLCRRDYCLANIDLWVGGVVEKRMPDALVGPTFSCIIGEQVRLTVVLSWTCFTLNTKPLVPTGPKWGSVLVNKMHE